jgi:hypothetical protein
MILLISDLYHFEIKWTLIFIVLFKQLAKINMKKNYNFSRISKLIKGNATKACLSLLLVSGISINTANSQTTYTFTNAGATGNIGPTQSQINTAYSSTNLNGLVTTTAGIQSWTVPSNGLYKIDAYGAEGGFSAGNVQGGLGANITGTLNLTAGQVLLILVGQQGGTSNHGGGGTFITDNLNNPIIIAGGGGGGCGAGGVDNVSKNGQITTSASNGAGAGAGIGGTAGNGGGIGASFASGAGGGLLTNGTNGWAAGTGGGSFISGGLGASANGLAGFGGGGNGSGIYVGGGGGGYSGGGAATNSGNSNGAVGGGGGSFNSAPSQTNLSGINSGNGKVFITSLCAPGATPTNTTPLANQSICSNNSATLSVGGAGTINWYTSASSTVTLGTGTTYFTPTLTVGNYTYYAASTNTCTEGSRVAITVSVNANPTVTAVSNTSLLCVGQTASLTASGANTFTWNTTATTSIIAVSPTVTTSYTVTGAGANGCTNASTITQSVSACTGINNSSNNNQNLNFQVYPNPNNGEFTISTESDINISIVNNLGQVVKVVSINASNNYKVSINNLTTGIYFIVGDSNNRSIKQKIVVSK